MKEEYKKGMYKKQVEVAVKRYGAKELVDNEGFVEVNGKIIDLTSSGSEDWQVASNIIKQLQ